MFGRDDPAPDIATLIYFLRQTHQEQDLYRGQEAAYPFILPSAYRSCVDAGATASDFIAVDPTKYTGAEQARQKHLRSSMMEELIGLLGIAWGNLLAQQYGIGSECIDLTEDVSIAAFFATRKWPEYDHIPGPGIGVLYRFRPQGVTPTPPRLDPATLDSWFEMGFGEGVYFDSFVHPENVGRIFDRDRWMEYETGREATVSTLPMHVRWADVLGAVRREVEGARPSKPSSDGIWSRQNFIAADWRRSRVAGQKGGFVRPAFVWQAEVPNSCAVWSGPSEPRPSPFGLPVIRLGSADDRMPWPRAVPSAAIKKRMIGIENLLNRPGTHAFYFRHSHVKVTGLYRRELWPEPSEDPVYAQLWMMALPRLIEAGEDMPPVDGLQEGILDRGYRVRDERVTRDARELNDLYRGQWEDAQEAIGGPEAKSKDFLLASAPLMARGDARGALRMAIRAVRMDPTSAQGYLVIADALEALGKGMWADKARSKAAHVAPHDPYVDQALGEAEFKAGYFRSAASRLQRVLESFDRAEHYGPEHALVEGLAISSGLIGDEVTLANMLARYQRMGFDAAKLGAHIASEREKHGSGWTS
jgi:hypothetical protein